MKLSCFESVELSDVGRKRKNNEDACLRLPDEGVYCVADGMGGVVGGQLASAAIIKAVRITFVETPAPPLTFSGQVKRFRNSANAASKWIRDFADEKGIGQMGSTLVGIVFDPENPRRAVGLHAGDSRLYRFRKGELEQVTADHTAAAALAAKLGREVASIPEKFHNELVRAVGLTEKTELEKTLVDVAEGDIFLLCSDGLTRMLTDETIRLALAQNNGASLEKIAQTLITDANEAGGKDNVTVVLIKIGDLSAFPKTFEPADLDEPKTDTGAFALESEPATSTRTAGAMAESSDYVGGDTPKTDDSPAMHADTPKTDDDAGPHTPPTAKLSPIPNVEPPPEQKPPGSTAVIAIAALIVILAVVCGILFHKSAPPPAPVSNNAPPAQHPAPAPAPVAVQPTPPPKTGSVVIHSDPSGADVWVGGQMMGKTPLPLELPGGPANVTLRVMGLADQVAAVTVGAGKTNDVNIIFPCGSVAIRSEPPGAAVERGGMVIGYTPCTIGKLAPGKYNWRLTSDGGKAKDISFEVADHQTSQISAALAKEQGVLQLTGNLPGIMAKLDGAGVGMLPATLLVDPTIKHTVTAEYQGAEQVANGVQAGGGQTNTVSFAFDVQPAAPARFTNNFLGLVLVKLPGGNEWVSTSRLTLDQLTKVISLRTDSPRENEENGQRYVVNLPSATVENFVAKLTDLTQGGDGLPKGAKNYHFAPPTTTQWMNIFDNADRLGIPIKDLHRDKEWCLDGGSWFMGGYVLQGTNFNPVPGCNPILPPPGADPRQFAIRLVLEP